MALNDIRDSWKIKSRIPRDRARRIFSKLSLWKVEDVIVKFSKWKLVILMLRHSVTSHRCDIAGPQLPTAQFAFQKIRVCTNLTQVESGTYLSQNFQEIKK